MRITLDTNCLIYLETGGAESVVLHQLRERSKDSSVTLCIPAISASERTTEGSYLASFSEFSDRLQRLGLSHAGHLLPMAYLDVCFWDHALVTDDNMLELERKIHDILHPRIAFEYSKYCSDNDLPEVEPSQTKWRNAKCDVQVAWAHIWHKADVLVTNDHNFLKQTKRPKLIELGAQCVIPPLDLTALLAAA